ncbi:MULTISPECIES: TetR/AcrR family transcriptional regulator [Subtercola]|uniref:TetR/AcrR family transcriptional regulator n=1 Tax=Subtercola vilae TaxID=2056433 RepID=A0A4T2C902_9MICO|nr:MULTISPECIES: TetR/AcrR family transcriptional regulator [Subtercola]MEA9984308.1 TetR/AcrR family transcriptional regulator [Subtercola sp. RTI3]TIH40122.1 TetR/AcrR family transcriptional regulator [Subtercola vilae]
MTTADRRLRERLAQRQLITSAARRVAESEGWDAVTTRRLSAEIEYSQPVIYKHFASLDDLYEAVALQSFTELSDALREARGVAGLDDVRAVAQAYLDFADEHPALYEAMFTRSTRLPFGDSETPAALTAAFAELRAGIASVAQGRDVDTLTEVFWAALHGLVSLQRGGRLRHGAEDGRLGLLVESLSL